jgi:hypothetical protein
MAEATYISPNCGAIQMMDVQASSGFVLLLHSHRKGGRVG